MRTTASALTFNYILSGRGPSTPLDTHNARKTKQAIWNLTHASMKDHFSVSDVHEERVL